MAVAEEFTGVWEIETVDGAEVRLRSGRIGLVSVDVKAPVTGGELRSAADGVTLTLRLALDQLKTGNFLMQAAARKLVTSHDSRVLQYSGTGEASKGRWLVNGHATAGDVDVELRLTVTPCGPAGHEMTEIELVGSASLGTVHLPLPGLGTVEDFGFDVDARLALADHAS